MPTSNDVIDYNPEGMIHRWSLSVTGYPHCVCDAEFLEGTDLTAVLTANAKLRDLLRKVETTEDAVSCIKKMESSGLILGPAEEVLRQTVNSASDLVRALMVVRRYSDPPSPYLGESENPEHAMYWAARQRLEEYHAHR